MNFNEEASVYGLITELCERFIDKNKQEEHPYLPRRDESNNLKKMRSRAFEILLKKSSSKYDVCDVQDADPVVELLKYTFVLKSALKRYSHAEELQNSLDELCDCEDDLDSGLYSVLTFLNGLKSFETKEENTLDVFHYGRRNPLLPEQLQNSKEVPQYQIYPVETFMVPERFDAMLGIESDFSYPENVGNPGGSLSFENRFKSATTIGIETLSTRSSHTLGSMQSLPKYTVRLVSTREFSVSSYFMPQISEDTSETETIYARSQSGFFSEPEQPWLCVKSSRRNYELNSEFSDPQSTNVVYDEEQMTRAEISKDLEIWQEIDDDVELKDHRTWETLGRLEAPKEPPFVTETPEAMLHLERIKQAGFLMLLPRKIVGTLNMITEVPIDEFMENIKLLLLGVESRTFTWNDKVGFILTSNTTISGLSVESTRSACEELTLWGESYKSLSAMTTPDPQTGKMKQDGLIFRAMCNSVKEILVYYQAVILRITVKNSNSEGLLKLLKNVRPVGSLIAEVARLCRCDRKNDEILDVGMGILSHIYDEVTKITKPNVALVFYSILKSCCEVYFQMIQKWLFEGICEDEYGEFMIKIRPQYVREKGHSFWTKGFAINRNSVPGFIEHLSDRILECGKTVRLLKICDSKNRLTRIFHDSQPNVRVCLSVGMVREQESTCRDFLLKGEELLGKDVSFSHAFDAQRRAEKKRADLVISAQRETLERIKREREETRINEAKSKRELLAELKNQAEEVATRKMREKEDELRKDKKYLEDMNAAEEIAKNAAIIEKQNTLDYYNELAAEVDRRKMRADWRTKRMKLFEERVNFIDRTRDQFEEQKILNEASNIDEIIVAKDNEDSPEVKNVPETSVDSPEVVKIVEEEKTEIAMKKSPRPCVLNIKTTTSPEITNLNANDESNRNYTNITKRPRELEFEKSQKITEAQRNKLRVMQQEYGMTPNNNEYNIIITDAEGNKNTLSIDASTLKFNNKRKNLEISEELLENKNTRYLRDSEKSNTQEIKTQNEYAKDSEKNLNVNSSEETDAQRNRRKNETDTYRDLSNANEVRVNFAESSELQRNRARVMGHDDRNYRDYEETAKNNLDTPMSEIIDEGITPMSCTTDTFANSMSNSVTQLYNCSNVDGKMIDETTTPFDSEFATNFAPSMDNERFTLDDNCSKKFFNHRSIDTPSFTSSLTIADVEIIDNTSLQVYLEKSISTPLRVQSNLANAAIVKYLINDCNALSHFRSLRSFFFLLNGEFAKSLTNSLYKRLYEISNPIELFRTSTLTNFLETALNSSLSSTYENSDRLSLSVAEVPQQLQVSNPEFLNGLCLNYKISWPLNIIIDDRLLQQYSKVFKFLLMVGRVLYVLQEDFNILKVERKATVSSQYHKLQLYRHSMMQFITALHNYLTCSVLHASWTEFENDLGDATTIDQIYLIHVNYVKKILSRCMLTSRGEKMRVFLCNIFKVILKFHNRVRSQNWSTKSESCNQSNFERLENMYKTFCDARTYLAHVANKLASSGYQPHLTHFLNALNINPLYDLAHMGISKKT